MNIFKEDALEFLDLSDVEESEKNRVLSSLRCGDSNVKLPWIITKNVPSKHNTTKHPPAAAKSREPSRVSAPIVASYVPHPAAYPIAIAPYSVAYPVLPIAPPPVYSPYQPHLQPLAIYPTHDAIHVTSPIYNFSPTVCVADEEADQWERANGADKFANVAYGVPTEQPFPTARPDEQKPAEPKPTDGRKSWASLFNSKASNVQPVTTINVDNNGDLCPIKHPKRASFVDPTCYRMAEYLSSYEIDGKTISLQPRGLVNRSNYCYINSILQALLACPPLYNLLSGLVPNGNEKRKPTPVIDGMCRFVKEFEHLPAGQRVGRRTDKKKEPGASISCDAPLEPAWFYKMLNGMRSDSFLIEGRQEDAEEFLGCLLNGLNDEMHELLKLLGDDGDADGDEPDDDWQVMGPRNKGSVTRKTNAAKTPISRIFGGLLRSKIHRQGDESTNNIQPFFTLQLNIEKVKSVNEALEALVMKNQLEGVTSSKTNEEVEAWQQVNIEELPVVLILHLKCFDYKLNGCTKIVKALEFPIDLKIDSKLLSTKITSPKERQFKLFAVVYHDGKEASKGHYITDAFHVGYNSWIRYDDASVKAIPEEQVLTPQGSRVPYLLFYRRSDTFRNK